MEGEQRRGLEAWRGVRFQLRRQRREAIRQREKNTSRGERKKAVGEEPYK